MRELESRDDPRQAAMAAHPAGEARPTSPPPTDRRGLSRADAAIDQGEDGSMLAEYGLLFVLGGTVVMLATKWAAGGAVHELLGAVLKSARSLVGA